MTESSVSVQSKTGDKGTTDAVKVTHFLFSRGQWVHSEGNDPPHTYIHISRLKLVHVRVKAVRVSHHYEEHRG